MAVHALRIGTTLQRHQECLRRTGVAMRSQGVQESRRTLLFLLRIQRLQGGVDEDAVRRQGVECVSQFVRAHRPNPVIAQRAGIDAARLADHAARDAGEPIKYRGRRPTFDAEKLQQTHELLSMGWSPSVIAKEVGLSRATVYPIEADPEKAAALLHSWGIS